MILDRSDKVVQELQQLVGSHHALQAQLRNGGAGGEPQHWEQAAAVALRVQEALDALLPQMDDLCQSVRANLDDCHLLLAQQPPLAVPPAEVLSYAFRLRHTTFASLGVLPGQPPAPQTWHMQNSALHAFARAYEQRQRGGAATGAAEPEPPAPAPPPSVGAAAGAVPLFLPAIPADWQPGMPIPDLPAIPEGWRPGDPIPFMPQLASLVPPPPAAAAAAAPGPAAAPQAAAAVPAAGAAAAAAAAVAAAPDVAARQVKPAAGGGGGGLDLAFLLNPDLEVSVVSESSESSEYSDDEF